MWVQLKEVLNTGRYDGRPWPPLYTDFEVPDWDGERMIVSGLAIRVAGPPPVPPGQDPPPAPEPVATIPELVSEPSSTGMPEPPLSPEPELPEPAPGDSKQAWVDYAVSQGASSGEAATMTKAQLQQAYGGRL